MEYSHYETEQKKIISELLQTGIEKQETGMFITFINNTFTKHRNIFTITHYHVSLIKLATSGLPSNVIIDIYFRS